jgi:hypothetical protein
MSAVYKKILRMSSVSSSVGELINVQSNDGARVVEAFRFGFLVSFTPVVFIVVTGLIIKEIGWAGLIGVLLLVIIMGLQTWVGS